MYLPLQTWHFAWTENRIRDQKGLWLTSFFRNIAFSLISIFSSVFIFELGKTHFLEGGVRNGLLLLLLNLLILHFTVVFLGIPIGQRIIKKIGYRRSIIISLVLTSISFLSNSLVESTQSLTILALGSFIQGLGICLYWPTYYTLFADDTNDNRVGTDYAILEAFNKLGHVAAPLVGALIITGFGYSILFQISVIFLMIAGIPMVLLKHHQHTDDISWDEFATWLQEKRFLRVSFASGGHAIQEKLHASIWPIYVLIIIGSITKLGAFHSIVMLAGIFFTFLIGRLFDKKHDRKLHAVGVIAEIFAWIFRLILKSPVQLLVVETSDGFARTTARTFFLSSILRRSKGKQTFSFIIYYIMSESIWYSIVLLAMINLLIWVDVEYFWYFLAFFAVLGTILSFAIRDKKEALDA